MTRDAAELSGQPKSISFIGADGNRLIGDLFGTGPCIVFVHGGGQTRHSWWRAAARLASAGYSALTFDLRGHGDSDWVADGKYGIEDNAGDLRALITQLDERPAVVGAFIGGLAALTALGAPHGDGLARALVLVDVTPRMEASGLDRIRNFMLSAPGGFADLEAAAEAVAAYLPDRHARATTGLAKNLRIGADNRYYWHWDPRILEVTTLDYATHQQSVLSEYARAIQIPTLLVRGGRSDVVSEESVRDLRQLIPHAIIAEVGTAAHMVTGDDNNAFAETILSFVSSR